MSINLQFVRRREAPNTAELVRACLARAMWKVQLQDDHMMVALRSINRPNFSAVFSALISWQMLSDYELISVRIERMATQTAVPESDHADKLPLSALASRKLLENALKYGAELDF